MTISKDATYTTRSGLTEDEKRLVIITAALLWALYRIREPREGEV